MRLALAIVAAILNLADASLASACRCLPNDTVEAQYERAELVFFGRVTFHNGAESRETQRRYWELEVEGVWKGPVQQKIRIYAHSPKSGLFTSCDRELETGKMYLVFASTFQGYPGRFQAGKCSGTVVGADAIEALRVIGAPTHRFSGNENEVRSRVVEHLDRKAAVV